jgi:hypothetical protein
VAEENIRRQGLGELYHAPYDGEKGCCGEWGFTFLSLRGYYAGDGMLAEGCGWIENTPRDDADAVAIMRRWIFKQYAGKPFVSDHYPIISVLEY